MKRITHRSGPAISLVALALAAMTAAAPIAAASGSGAPFKDANTRGGLTFCNRAGQAMTSGSLDTAPFAWKTVSSARAPAGYRGPTARATLFAYQPIQYVDPGDWSGQQLTGASSFTNPAHPVVQATNVDAALLGFSHAYPAHWDGTVELRVYYLARNTPIHSQTYPAAVIRITGNSWSLLSGGGTPCSAGKGVSDETKLLPKKRLKKAHAAVPAGSATPAAAQISPTGKSSSTSQPSARSSAGGSGGATNANPASNAADSSGLGSGAKAAIGLGVVALVGIGLIGVQLWRRRIVDRA